ncbi:uncharacterized protein GGS25DRAFT_490026 [Hypoxylon fragiforme]|uniref:uncharacterized protein n=1 Tax=Hypoxylon fragiforme TaxID=63214 RepID=UPI0020C73CCA|nr:uncharacterized protein GGS25DRAFT_490026 [Hypoxylon fragiforme]KAI2608391.1 hypothetical protein GGS25DRAFT_490026 [Hypoxylon fragiforme]
MSASNLSPKGKRIKRSLLLPCTFGKLWNLSLAKVGTWVICEWMDGLESLATMGPKTAAAEQRVLGHTHFIIIIIKGFPNQLN